MIHMEEKLEKTFINIRFWDRILDRVKAFEINFHLESQKLFDKLEEFKDEEEGVVDEICERIMDEKLSEYDKVKNDFSKYFGNDALEC